MSKNANQLLPPPFAMRSYSDPTALAPTESSLIQGFWPAREGVLRCPSPLQSIPVAPTQTILGFAWYTDRRTPAAAPWNTRSRLLVFYADAATGLPVETFEMWQLDGVGGARKCSWTYPGAGSAVSVIEDPGWFTTGGFTGVLAEGETVSRTRSAPVRWVQQDDELFFVYGCGAYPRRFWVDVNGVPWCSLLGMYAPDVADGSFGTFVNYFAFDDGWGSGAPVGNMVPTTTYTYRIFWSDNKGRLGDASEDKTWVLGSGSHPTAQSVYLQIPRRGLAALGYGVKGATRIYIARAAQGTDTFYFINPWKAGTEQTAGYYTLVDGDVGNVVLEDRASETTLISGDLAPLPGENGLPPRCSMLAIEGNRLWTDDRSYGGYIGTERVYPTPTYTTNPNYTDTPSLTRIWASNLNGYSQFNLVADPTREDLGASLQVGSSEGGMVSGLMSYGATLGVWKTDGQWLITGNSAADWSINFAHNKGCINPDSIGRVKGITYFMSQDGIWGENADATMPIPVSIPVQDYFTRYDGDQPQPADPAYSAFDPATAKGGGLQEDETKQNAWYPLPQAALESAIAYVQDGRYYVSIPTRDACLCLDPSAPIASGEQSVPAYYRALDMSMGWAEMGFVPDVALVFKEEGWGERLIATGSIRELWDPAVGQTIAVVTQHLGLNADSAGALSPWTKRVRIGPFDGIGNDRAHRKQAISLTVFGSFRNNDSADTQNQVGTVSLTTDTGRTETYPIMPVIINGATPSGEQPRIMPAGSIWRQKFTPSMKGLVLQAEIALWSPEVTIDNAILEYIPLDNDPMPVRGQSA